MIRLSSGELAVTLDPAHGGEILSVLPRTLGVDLLGHPPFAPAPPRGGDLDEEAWTASYRGGWQLAAPNAGPACSVAGAAHGFHGRASVDPWEVLESGAAHVVLAWSGHGVALRRRVEVAALTVSAELEWTAAGTRAAPLIAVEHVAVGSALLDPEVEILAAADARELSETDGPCQPGDDVCRWPRLRLLDGGVEEAGRWAFANARGRFAGLSGFRDGRAEIHNRARGVGVRLDWDATALPAAWLWHEVRHSGGAWDRRAELLGFEPSAVPHALGLAEAVTAGQALWARPGRRERYRISLTALGDALTDR